MRTVQGRKLIQRSVVLTAAFDSEQIETDDEYHADTATISKTMLNEYCKSPVNFNLMFNKGTMERKRPTKVMQIGTIMHAVLLEKKSVAEVCEAYSTDCFKSNGDLNPKPAAAFRESIGGKIAVKSKDLLEIYDCYEAIATSPLYDAIRQSTECEKRHDAVVAGVPCRCKPDILCDMGEYVMIYDLKFCDPSPGAFMRSANNTKLGFRYWLQDAHYSAVVREELGKPVMFRFFAVEPMFPFRVQCYWYGPRQREIARDFHSRKLGELKHSMETDTWVDDWPNELPLEPWDIGSSHEEEPELEGFDDE